MIANKSTAYRPDIDGLRAIAVLMVVGFHAFPGRFHGGFVGVDIFFVISGFLISSILLNELKEDRFSISHFLSRRILRIFPSLIVVLLACWIFGWINLLADEYAQLGKHIAGGALFIDNFLFWREIGYFDQAAEVKPLLHLWSLGVEEQFYLIYPLLLFIAFKNSWAGLKTLYLISLSSFCLSIYLSFNSPSAAFFLPFTRFWEFFLGSYVAIIFSKNNILRLPNPRNSMLLNAIPIIGISLIALSFGFIGQKSTFPGFWALLPTMGAVLVLAAPQKSWINKKVLSHPLLTSIGLISYPLYLWHWPLLSFAHIMHGETPSLSVRIIAIATAFLFSWICYFWVERPIRYGITNIGKTYLLLIGMCLVAGLGLITFKQNGFPGRIPEKYQELQELFRRTDNATPECIKKFGGGGNSYCQISEISKAPTALLIGDSHAGHFYHGLNLYYQGNGGNLLNMGAGGCPPFYGIQYAKSSSNSLPLECHHYEDAFKVLFQTSSIDTVIFAFDHSAYLSADYEIHYKDKKNANPLDAFSETIKKIQASGKKVVVIYDLPDLKIDIKKCFAIRRYEIGDRLCQINDEVWKQDFENYSELIKNIKKNKDVIIFETTPWIKGNFPVDKGGMPMYMDKTHLNRRGSEFFTDKYNF